MCIINKSVDDFLNNVLFVDTHIFITIIDILFLQHFYYSYKATEKKVSDIFNTMFQLKFIKNSLKVTLLII